MLFIIVVVSLFTGQVLHADPSACTTLKFVTVAPSGHSEVPRCNPGIDKQACQVDQGFSRFSTQLVRSGTDAGKEALLLKHSRLSFSDYNDYVVPLENSPAIHEMNGFRILARRLARGTPLDACEPNYIYLGDSEVFGMGPAFVSSKRFLLDGKVTTNVIVAEDAGAPYHLPLKMISKRTLSEGSYYDLVIAHELAHAMMEDLYGVDGFAKLEKRVVTRDGHFSSAVTDPTLAWIEGFAEGFEAYFGEKYLSPQQQSTPYLDHLFQTVFDRASDFQTWGWGGYIFTIPGTILRTAKTMIEMDKFVTDFLKAERQRPIRDNHYVLQGLMVNLAHNYGFFPSLGGGEADTDALINWSTESDDAVYSKEGAVAHLIYRILKEGLLPEALETIVWGKPRDVWEFAEELRTTLSEEQFSRIEDAYKTIFTAEGRAAVRSRLLSLIDPENRKVTDPEQVERRYREALAPIRLPELLHHPKDLWVEFWTASLVRRKLYGRMDRINLATATPGRVMAFLETIPMTDARREAVLGQFLYARTDLLKKVESVEDFVTAWKKRTAQSPYRDDILETADKMLLMRRCYTSSCLSHELPGE